MKRIISRISLVLIFGITLCGCSAKAQTPITDDTEIRTSLIDEQNSAEIFTPESINSNVEKGKNSKTSLYLSFNPELSTSIKDITAEIKNVYLDPINPSITICTNVPTLADWLPIFSAQLDGKPINVLGVAVLNSDTAYKEINRCYQVSLATELVTSLNETGTLIFSMDYFKLLLPEKFDTTSEIASQAKAESQKQGVNFEVQSLEHGWNVVVTKKPEEMSEETALQIALNSLEIQAGKVEGPWVFTIPLINQ